MEPKDFSSRFQPTTEANALELYFQSNKTGNGIWKWTHYFEAYHRHLSRFVGHAVQVAEVGIYSGGSLSMWRDYFGEKAVIHGIDIENACREYSSDGIEIHIGDQEDREFWRSFYDSVPVLDVMIDDGGHTSSQQIITLEETLPRLHPGGVYICEDIHGIDNQFLDYVFGLISQLNQFTFINEPDHGSEITTFQKMFHSIHVYPYLLVIEKLPVTREHLLAPRNGTRWQPFFASTN